MFCFYVIFSVVYFLALIIILTLGTGLYICGGVGWGEIMGRARPIFLEKRGGPKENFTMVGGGSLCVL